MEHQARLEAIQSLAQKIDLPLIITEDYKIVDYFRHVVGNEAQRCQYCFRLRLLKTAETAHQMGFSAFTTTLLISPHQKHDLLREIGNQLAEETGVEFLYTNLRKRYSDSRRMTKQLDLHRQQYCGCVYSEWERYADVTIA
jgi:predicted adenine nucleotide alpha hydrolase (AANH) superfamily ATPase